jgi:hypothetical protein
MTSYPGQPKAPSRTLTWLAITSFVVGLVLSAFFIWRAVQDAPGTPQPIDNGPVQVDSDGFTIYSSIPVLRPPCAVRDESGNDVALEEPTTDTTITVNNDTWYVVANSVDRVPGTFAVSCLDDQTGATYAVGPRLSLVAFVGSIIAAIASFVVFFIVGVVLIIVNTVKTRRAKRDGAIYPGNTFPSGPAYPAGPTYPAAPGYPPQNYPQPGATYPPQNPGPPPGGVDPRWPTPPDQAAPPKDS